MQYLSVLLPVAAMVSGALASPAWGAGSDDCLAAVTGSAALGDAGIRASHCKSFLATTVTPIVTETVYITGKGNDNWKRATVAYCPNEVPNYASACDDAHYTSACSRFGFTDVITTTVAPTTTTKTIWVKPTGGAGTCTATTVTKAGATNTVTVGGATTVTVGGTGTTVTSTETIVKDGSLTWTATTVTVTVATATPTTVTVTDYSATATIVTLTDYSATATTVTVTDYSATATTLTVTDTATCSTSSVAPSKCNVDDALATKLVTNFEDLLINTGSNWHQDISDATLATDFVDISDSINFMSGAVPLGGISFKDKAAFDDPTFGQRGQPGVSISYLNIWHDCDSVTWRWRISSLPLPVTGISFFTVNDDLLIQRNYVEFDNGAWLQSYGQNCSFGSPFVQPSTTDPVIKRGLLSY